MAAFGKYTLVELLGRGGMAEVWRATSHGPAGFEKTVALKRMRAELAIQPATVDMFISEAKLVAQLGHPNIVQVFEFGAVGSSYYLAMEHVPGVNLGAILRRAPISFEAAVFVLVECLKGLAHAHGAMDGAGHSLEIVHRDVSPQNLLVSVHGDVKLSDFGIAKAAGAISHTEPGSIRGKLRYMSPEQARGETLDARSDVFAVGIIAWELLTGGILFSAENELDVLREVSAFRPEDARLSVLPEAARPIMARALEPDRERRWSAAQLEAAFTGLVDAAGLRRAREELAIRSRSTALPVPENAESSTLRLPCATETAPKPSEVVAPRPTRRIATRGCRSRAAGAALLTIGVLVLLCSWIWA